MLQFQMHFRNSEVTSARTAAAMTYSKENEVEIDDDRNDIADDDEAVFIDDAEPKRRNTLATMKVKLSREKPCVQIELLTTVNGNCRRHQWFDDFYFFPSTQLLPE